jgi:hypothetical protein
LLFGVVRSIDAIDRCGSIGTDAVELGFTESDRTESAVRFFNRCGARNPSPEILQMQMQLRKLSAMAMESAAAAMAQKAWREEEQRKDLSYL